MKVPNIEGVKDIPTPVDAQANPLGQILSDPRACREAFKASNDKDSTVRSPESKSEQKTEGQLQHAALEAAAKGDFKKAEKIFLELLRLVDKNHGRNSEDAASVLTQLGMVCENDGRFADAKGYYKQAVKVDQVVYGKDAFETGLNVQNVAHMDNLLGNFPEAQRNYEEVLRIYRLNDPYKNPIVGTEMVLTIKDYATMLMKMGQKEKAAALLREAQAIAQSINARKRRES